RGFNPSARSVHFLSERSYLVGNAGSIRHFLDTAKKPEDGHPLSASLAPAGKHHAVLGVALTERLSREAKQALKRTARQAPVGVLQVYSFRPLLDLQQGVMTIDVGDETRVSATIRFPDAHMTELGQDAVRSVLHALKGGLIMVEEDARDALGELKPDSALLKYLDGLRAALNEASGKAEGKTIQGGLKVRTDRESLRAII